MCLAHVHIGSGILSGMDELHISGKRFISSRRIARDNGYTADYIGQLIRGGKVTGQKVGRAWYVDAISFDTYLGQEGQVQPEQQVQQDLPPHSEEKKEEEVAVVYQVPLHIKKEKPVEEKIISSGGLRYYADDEPGLPEISNETRVFTAAEKNIVPLAPLRRETFASAQNKKHSRIKIFTLAGAGLAVFIFCAVVSSAVSLNLSIEAGNTASAFYTIGF